MSNSPLESLSSSSPSPDGSLSGLIEKLLQPDTYPHRVTAPIQLIQTHISLIFLTGAIAYKLKKPVNFGFLDFSTLEKRRHFCQEEVRLNQRGAPELYLKVVSITRAGDRLMVDGDGEAIDYVVKMQQFDQEQLFSGLFDTGKLGGADMVKLGHRVASFHQQSQTNESISGFGDVAQIKAAIDENYQQTEGFIGGPQTPQQFQQTRTFTDHFFTGHAEWFKQRQATGQIRECHGDLHLRNICYWHDQIQLFDCIEFNDAFRFVDVMYDVAFTVMDLQARQRDDLSTIFLNTYLEDTGDWEGLKVLPLYLSRQAYVRAKVQSFMSVDQQLSAAEQEQAAQIAAMYYHLAWEYTQPQQGQIWLMSGLSGSGKSTVARYLAPQQGSIHLRSDAMRKHLAGTPLYERGDASLYTAEMTQRTYQQLINVGIELAKLGYGVILDAKFDQRFWRQEAIAQATAASLPITIFHCTAPMDVLRDRLNQRQGDITDATADLLQQQQAHADPFEDDERPYLKTIDTTEDWKSIL